MRTALIVYLLTLVIFSNAQVDQDVVDSTDTSQDRDKPLTGPSSQPYGIPVGTWKITNSNATERDSICNEQQSFCSNECGGPDSVLKNFCNRSTMAWDCKCKGHVPDTPPYGWPITIAECHGKETTCINGCSYGSTNGICLKACSRYYKCNRAGSPPSGLQVEDEYIVPDYYLVAESMNARSVSHPSAGHLLQVSCFVQLAAAALFIVILQTFLY